MQNKALLVTVGIGGIGQQTALGLARLGARVIFTGRDRAHGETTINALKQSSGNQRVDLLLVDLSTQAGVRLVTDQFRTNYGKGWSSHCINFGGIESDRWS